MLNKWIVTTNNLSTFKNRKGDVPRKFSFLNLTNFKYELDTIFTFHFAGFTHDQSPWQMNNSREMEKHWHWFNRQTFFSRTVYAKHNLTRVPGPFITAELELHLVDIPVVFKWPDPELLPPHLIIPHNLRSLLLYSTQNVLQNACSKLNKHTIFDFRTWFLFCDYYQKRNHRQLLLDLEQSR